MRIVSDRLMLRPWQDADRAPFAEMSADPAVMQYLLPLTTRDASDAWIDRQMAHLAAHGFCFWAVEADGGFVGTVGLGRIGYTAHFTPAVEIGWRIARAFWGLGYAPEAARAALRFGFETAACPEIVANAGFDNDKSQRVMAKLGMSRDPADDFDHPRVPEGDPLRRQVLYRLRRENWLRNPTQSEGEDGS
jgi:RimJ/RimL family protein N-acetyltransferase